jgi:hypothetical protein
MRSFALSPIECRHARQRVPKESRCKALLVSQGLPAIALGER